MATYLRYNSSIKQKVGTCVDCPPEKGEQPVIAGRCTYHYAIKLKIKSRDKLMERDAEKKLELDAWFDARSQQMLMKPYCLSCGEKIFPVDYRNCTAHILEKRHFISIATHPMNWIPLGVRCGCHAKYDRSFLDAELMENVWPTVIARFKILYPFISKEEYKYIPECLLKTINV